MITLGKFQIPASICRMLAAIKLILQFKTTNVIKDKLLYWPGGGVLPNMGYIGMCGPKG